MSYLRFHLALAFPLMLAACGDDDGGGNGGDDGGNDDGGRGNIENPVGSCAGTTCDGQAPDGNCWCDSACPR